MINLLPPEEQMRRGQEKTLKIVWNIGILLIASFIALIFMILSTKIYLWDQIDAQQALIEYEKDKSQQVEELKTRVDDINATLSNLNDFYDKQFSSSQLLEQVEVLLPGDLYLDTYLYQETKSLISISGYSDDVETIYQLRKNLRDSELFKDIELTLSDWLETEKINFRVEFILQDEL